MQKLRPREVEVPTYPYEPTQLLAFHLLGLGFLMSRVMEFMSDPDYFRHEMRAEI
jgi:hypothetical protein